MVSIQNITKKILIGNKTVDGYYKIKLKLKNGSTKDFYYHRVMWYYFNGEIPEGLQVNHIDEDKSNNVLSNLSLMTPNENINYGTRSKRNGEIRKGKQRKPIYQFSLDGELVDSYKSARECERKTHFTQTNISKACRGIFKTYKNYIWSYTNNALGSSEAQN